MKSLSVFSLALVIGTESLFAQTQPELPQPLDSLIVSGTDLIMRQDYTAALEHFQRVCDQFPGSPAGFLFQAATLQARAVDFRDFQGRALFDSLLSISRAISEELVEQQPDSPWGHYYLGTSLGMDSYDRIQRGELFSGYFKGSSSVSEIEKTLELDSTFFDCYSILGSYYYWKSRKTEFLNWLPFFHDDRTEGVRFLHLAIQSGRYQRYPALSNLVWIYLDAENFTEAETFARIGLQIYPNQRTFLNGLANALMKQEKYAEAKSVFERLLQEILSAGMSHRYNELVCRLNIVKMKRELHEVQGAQEQLSQILSAPSHLFPSFLREPLNEKLAEARKLQEELSNGGFTGQ